MLKKLFFALPIATVASTASAGTLVCSGTVDELSYHASGNFMLRLSSMNKAVMFCSPEQEWVVPGTAYKTGPEVCKMLYSTFLAAKMTGKPIHNLYWDGDQVPTSCIGWGDWFKANIRHYKL